MRRSRDEQVYGLREILDARSRNTILPVNMRRSAVLVPLCWKDGAMHTLLTKRSMQVEYHKGEISFPGGSVDPQDRDIVDTALREAREEIGLDPSQVDVLGCIDDYRTIVGFHITPIVGVIPWPYDFRINSESDSIVYFSMARAFEKGAWMEERITLMGQEVDILYMETGDHVIWGATARILKQVCDLFKGDTIPTIPPSERAKARVADIISRQNTYERILEKD
ncbi:MAG: CoA pyrophosphatase [Thermodesulfobacteriota bacterium]|nr:CoA pyrophosphatase [Thermodesulfobacteriota bacterium]